VNVKVMEGNRLVMSVGVISASVVSSKAKSPSLRVSVSVPVASPMTDPRVHTVQQPVPTVTVPLAGVVVTWLCGTLPADVPIATGS
jgi:hypothetical protein